MQIDLAIIGGTGIGSRLAELPGRSLFLPTARGPLRGRLVEFGGAQVLAIQRHAAGHAKPPHKVGYAAFALGLKAMGVKHCMATAAAGSVRADWPIGTIVACTDFIDASGRNLTLFNAKVVHTAMESPFGSKSSALQNALKEAGIPAMARAVYVQTNGPRYETDAEIRAFAELGGDLVGMTAASEATVMREAGIHYECLAVVTNLAAGLGQEIDHGAVGDVMTEKAGVVFQILEKAARHVSTA
jgi:5'-methylthioadenosine phosphorylase